MRSIPVVPDDVSGVVVGKGGGVMVGKGGVMLVTKPVVVANVVGVAEECQVKSQNNFIHLKRAISIGSMQVCLK
jgi:hypothetical protein